MGYETGERAQVDNSACAGELCREKTSEKKRPWTIQASVGPQFHVPPPIMRSSQLPRRHRTSLPTNSVAASSICCFKPNRFLDVSLIGERVCKCDMRSYRRVEKNGGGGKDNSEGIEVRRTLVEAREALTVTQTVDHTTADNMNPNATSSGSTVPVDGSRNPTVRVGITATRVKHRVAR